MRWTSILVRFCALITAAACTSGCLILYLPQTYHVADTTVLSSPFPNLLVEYNDQISTTVPLSVSVYNRGIKNPLPVLQFVQATVLTDDGMTVPLRLNRARMENPSSYRMEFYRDKIEFVGRHLQLRLTLLSEGKPVTIRASFYIKTKVHWPKDSDFSG